MRKLMWFAIGFGAACAFGAYCYVSWLLPAGLFFMLLAALFAVLTRRTKMCRIGTAICLGIAVGLCWFSVYDSVYLGNARALDSTTANVAIEVSDYSYETDYGCAFDGRVTLGKRTYQVRTYLDENAELEPGDIVTGEFRFRLTTNGGAEDPLYHQGKGIFLLAYQKDDCQIQTDGEIRWTDYPVIWRQKLKTMIDSAFPEDVSGFCKALLLGDRTDIDYETNTAFKLSGVSHVIAVSGLHISILFGFLYLITGRRRVLTAVIGVPVVAIFAAIAGFTPSITRASIMQIVLMVAMLFDKEYDPPTSLGFAALIMLVINPLVITSVSFQLSFACMAGIFLFGERIRSWIMDEKRLGRWKGKLTVWFSSSVSITLSAMVFTTPLVAVYFGTVSLIGVVTNLLTLWVITFIFYGIMAVCAVAGISAALAGVLGWIVAWPIRYVLVVTKFLADLPLSAVYTKSIYILLWLIFAYVLLAVYLLVRRKPAALFAGLLVAGLFLGVTASWAEPLLDECRVTALDVGQGQSILLQSGGKSFLVDCGGNYNEDAADMAADTLLSQGITRLDGIIVTHYDEDHAGGLPYLLTRIETDMLFLPYIEDEEGAGQALAKQVGDRAYFVSEDLKLSFGIVNISIFAPLSFNSSNEGCISVLFQTENCDILITGDMGQEMEKLLLKLHELPKLELLVVGHHGSKYSTCEELLAATMPEYAFISVGKDNFYGHPTQEVLERLGKYGCTVYRTDENGTIIFRR